jgi:hypothetical protein
MYTIRRVWGLQFYQVELTPTPFVNNSHTQPEFLVLSEERFNGTNWVDWKSTIWAAAKSCGLTGYLSGNIE